jgi:D-glycerate 3-kinase
VSEAVATIRPWQRSFLDAHRLPDAYLDTANKYFEPLAGVLAQRRRTLGSTLHVALNGSQGSGKSTLGDYLCSCLAEEYGLSAVALSLDDFYLTRAERLDLAERIHPLLRTRGVPGTHDVELLRAVLNALSRESLKPVSVPRFDKSIDDRAPQEVWTLIDAPVDVVVLEGWCLGATSEEPGVLAQPINTLERDEDTESQWRTYSNEMLRQHYEPFYADLDVWIMLAAPGFEQVLRWRTEQEEKLRESVVGQGEGVMSDATLSRFVQHFERYTRQCLRDLPQRADVLLKMDGDRNIVRTHGLESRD